MIANKGWKFPALVFCLVQIPIVSTFAVTGHPIATLENLLLLCAKHDESRETLHLEAVYYGFGVGIDRILGDVLDERIPL